MSGPQTGAEPGRDEPGRPPRAGEPAAGGSAAGGEPESAHVTGAPRRDDAPEAVAARPEPEPEPEPVRPGTDGRRARAAALLRPRLNRGQLIIAVLCALLGFAVAAAVRANDRDTRFATARQDELVGILGDLSQRSDRLRGDIRDLEETKSGLERDTLGQTAVEDARRRAVTYGMLAGTLPAQGPGIELTIEDPRRKVRSGDLLDTLEELRDAGAEVIQVGDVRVGVNTYFADSRYGGVIADGRPLAPPYRFLAIGDPHTLATALDIPGGVLQTLRNSGARGIVVQEQKIIIRAVRSP